MGVEEFMCRRMKVQSDYRQLEVSVKVGNVGF